MITTGINIQKIAEKLAVLQNEISLSGKISYLDIHKQAENLFRDVLSIATGVRLENLNEHNSQFEGLDIGSKTAGIAYQVTSTNTSDKINDTLAKVLTYGHDKVFPRVVIFLLSNKKSAYTIKPLADTSFVFDEKSDIMDFRDLLKKIENLPGATIELILQHLEKELIYPVFRTIPEPEKRAFLIDVEQDKSAAGLPYYFHCAVKLNIPESFSVATLQRHFDKELNTDYKRTFLPVFHPDHRKKSETGSKDMKYEIGLRDEGQSTHFKHFLLVFKTGEIGFEAALYRNNAEITSWLNEQVGGLLTLLITLKSLFKSSPMSVYTEITLNSNGKLYFHSQNSLLETTHRMTAYYLDPPHSLVKTVTSTTTEDLAELLQEIANGFIVNEDPFFKGPHYLTLDEGAQKIKLDQLRNMIGPTLQEIV